MRRIIINGKKRGSITGEQEKFIREHRMEMDVPTMADHLKVPVSRLYSFLRFYNLDFKMRRPRQVKKETQAEELFQVDARDNWIL